MAKVEVKSASKDSYKQEISTGKHHIAADAPKAFGGEEAAPDPHELLLAALGACSSITMQMYAKRKGYPLNGVDIQLSETKQDDTQNPGQSMTLISKDIKVSGELTPDQVNDLKAIADKCPVHKLISGNKQINTTISKN
jgi:putative redox protein